MPVIPVIPTTPVIPVVTYIPSVDTPLVRQTPILPPSTVPLSPRSPTLSSLFCGDGVRSGSEECDDGNTRGLDGCSEDCRLETGICGDGTVQAGFGEQCDEGKANGTAGSMCDTSCRIIRPPSCGDGILDGTEECDLGARNSNAPFTQCLLNCLLPYCGDGIVSIGEECDDGNQFSLDGCDSTCRRETQFAAPDTSSPGSGTIGGGALQGSVIDVSRVPTPARTPTGPGLVIFLASGAAAGVGLVRRKMRSM